jgi:hypothetical protein
MLRGKASVPVPVLKDVQGSEKLPDAVKTQDRGVRGVTGPPFVLCGVAHFTREKSSFVWYSVPLEEEYGS